MHVPRLCAFCVHVQSCCFFSTAGSLVATYYTDDCHVVYTFRLITFLAYLHITGVDPSKLQISYYIHVTVQSKYY